MKISSRSIARCGMIAAIYTAVSLLLAPLSFGAVQVRVAEALCLLCVFTPDAVSGVTLGCLLTNLLGSSPVDAVFGTLATLLAVLLVRGSRGRLRRGLPVLSSFWPVPVNGLIVGAEITFFMSAVPATPGLLLLNVFTVSLGEAVSCMLLGLLLVRAVRSNQTLLRLLTEQG